MTNVQARRFLLLRHGLAGPCRYSGKMGALEFVRDIGSIQFDPVDICGQNAQIVLQSRVGGFQKSMLDELLYKDRLLVDFFDKNLCIFPIEDWPYLVPEPRSGGYAGAFDHHGGDELEQVKPLIRRLIRERGCISAKDVEVSEGASWSYGSIASLPRGALESMYYRGELIIHHKNGAIKSYAFAEDHIPPEVLGAPSPFQSEAERSRRLVSRRIGAVGMLWNRGSDAWLGANVKAAERRAAFTALEGAGEIFEVSVEGIRESLYIRETERTFLVQALCGDVPMGRAEFIAPLDCLLWDRRLMETIFGFAYRWEIYTPAVKRKYGPYTLPFLWGDRFAGRADMERRDGALVVTRFWPEDGVEFTGKLAEDFRECAERFASFNGCGRVEILI